MKITTGSKTLDTILIVWLVLLATVTTTLLGLLAVALSRM